MRCIRKAWNSAFWAALWVMGTPDARCQRVKCYFSSDSVWCSRCCMQKCMMVLLYTGVTVHWAPTDSLLTCGTSFLFVMWDINATHWRSFGITWSYSMRLRHLFRLALSCIHKVILCIYELNCFLENQLLKLHVFVSTIHALILFSFLKDGSVSMVA